MKLEEICNQLSKEVIIFIKEWMKICNERESSFHNFRMKLLDMAAKEGNDISKKLIAVCNKSGARITFEIKQVISDKLIGETTASYIFASLIKDLNKEYLEILERDLDVITNENERLTTKIDTLAQRLGVH